MIVAQK